MEYNIFEISDFYQMKDISESMNINRFLFSVPYPVHRFRLGPPDEGNLSKRTTHYNLVLDCNGKSPVGFRKIKNWQNSSTVSCSESRSIMPCDPQVTNVDTHRWEVITALLENGTRFRSYSRLT